MFRPGWIMPFVVCGFQAADVADGMFATRGPKGHLGRSGQAANDVGVDRFLKDNDIRRNCTNHFGYLTLAPASAKANVVAKQLNNHEAFCASITMQ